MDVWSGVSQRDDVVAAVDEAIASWPQGCAPDLILVFHAVCYDADAVAAALAARFPAALVVGASAFGQWLDGAHYNASMVLTAIGGGDIRWSVAVAENLDRFDNAAALALSDRLLQSLACSRAQLSPQRHFCISLFDGLCCREEQVISAVATVLDGVPIIGGSASEDLRFQTTTVIANGVSYRNAALFLLADSSVPFVVCKHQHFSPTSLSTVITRVDEATRTVYTLDGYPAVERYAELLGLTVAELNLEVFSCHPLIYQWRDADYVRSISGVNDDGSLQLYTAIEEGMVLVLGEPQEMDAAFSEKLATLPQSELLLMFNCVLRAIESDMRQLTDRLPGRWQPGRCMSPGLIPMANSTMGYI